jgi:hypothetical protein
VFVVGDKPAPTKTLEDLGEGVAPYCFPKVKLGHLFNSVAIAKKIKCEKNASQNKIHQPQCASPYAKKNPVSTANIISRPRILACPTLQTVRTATLYHVPLLASRHGRLSP